LHCARGKAHSMALPGAVRTKLARAEGRQRRELVQLQSVSGR
jgi:hypothetical protein